MLDAETRQELARLQFNALVEGGDLHDDMPTMIEDWVVVFYGEEEWAAIQEIVAGLVKGLTDGV